MIGRTLLHYEILEKLGEGGMGEVWLARDSRLDREVAIKVLSPEVAADPERLERRGHGSCRVEHDPDLARLFAHQIASHEPDAVSTRGVRARRPTHDGPEDVVENTDESHTRS